MKKKEQAAATAEALTASRLSTAVLRHKLQPHGWV
jgi:hypothetical protein